MLRCLSGFLIAALLSAQTPAVPTQHTVTLAWTDTLNPAGTTYNVYRAVGICSGTPTFAKVATALTVKTYQDTTVTAGGYCYSVTPTFQGAEGPQSVPAPAAVLPFAVTGVTVTVQ